MTSCPVCGEPVRHSEDCPETDEIAVLNALQVAEAREEISRIAGRLDIEIGPKKDKSS